MLRRRPTACALLLAVLAACTPAAAAGTAAPADPPPTTPLHLHAAQLTQDGTALVLRFATSRTWSPASLLRDERSLCLRLVFRPSAGAITSRDVCVARADGKARLTLARVLRSGGHGPLHPLPARVRRPDERSLVARFDPARLGIPYAPLRWRMLSTTAGCQVGSDATCVDALPPAGALLSLTPPLPTGCTPAGPAFVTNGSRGARVVALTFDDGPWTDTSAFLGVLEREHVPGTFFLIGRQVAGHGALIRRMLGDGDMLGDHTWDHANVAGAGPSASSEIRSTAAAIRRESDFRPCLFRAPFGAVSPALIGLAHGLGFTTVQWDVDPQDWATPGSGAIAARILGHVQNGSIVLMHDGGGSRTQTLAALPGIIDVLRARGYRFETVTQMTGAALLYG